MKLALALLFCSAVLAQRTTVTGQYVYANGQTFSGTVEVRIKQAAVASTCTAGVAPTRLSVSFNGSLTVSNLVPSSCLVPAQNYTVTLYDSHMMVIAQRYWNVPASGGSVDVAAVDVAEQ